MKVVIEIGIDKVVHSTIDCRNFSFAETLDGLKLSIIEIQNQIDRREECPFNKSLIKGGKDEY